MDELVNGKIRENTLVIAITIKKLNAKKDLALEGKVQKLITLVG